MYLCKSWAGRMFTTGKSYKVNRNHVSISFGTPLVSNDGYTEMLSDETLNKYFRPLKKNELKHGHYKTYER